MADGEQFKTIRVEALYINYAIYKTICLKTFCSSIIKTK